MDLLFNLHMQIDEQSRVAAYANLSQQGWHFTHRVRSNLVFKKLTLTFQGEGKVESI